MREHLTVLTRKGQITVPAEVRRALGLKQGDKVAVVIDGQDVRLERAGSVIERTAGAARTDRPPLSAEELRRAAEEAWAQDAIERAGLKA